MVDGEKELKERKLMLNIELKKAKRMASYWDKKYCFNSDKRRRADIAVDELEREKRKLTHKYDIKDLVYLVNRHEICEVEKLIGVKRYKVFCFMGATVGTDSVVNESEITCNARILPKLYDFVKKGGV